MTGVVGAAVAIVSEEDFLEAQDSNLGWCPSCASFTRECTEPDAEGYDCPECKQLVVVGADQALLCGLIEFGGGE